MSDRGNASSLRGLDQGEHKVFALMFQWAGPMRTSLHKHRGWELVLVRSGQLSAIVDSRRVVAESGGYLELPAGTSHAIWSSASVTFDVIGEVGLGLWMIVPDAELGTRDVPIYDGDGPWRLQPPVGSSYTTAAEVDQLRRLSQTLF